MRKPLITILLVLAAVGLGVAAWQLNARPGELDTFVQCLKDKGAVFYGAFWCQHCQSQKAIFGRSQRLLPYVECSTPNAQGMLPVCQQQQITGYPTWTFADGTRESGTLPLVTLAAKTGCSLPTAP